MEPGQNGLSCFQGSQRDPTGLATIMLAQCAQINWIRTQGLGGNFSGQELIESVEKHGNGQPGAGDPAHSSQLWRSGVSQAV